MDLPWHQYMMGLLYILAGLNHFRQPRLYVKIIPPYFKNPNLINKVSGILEIIFGIGICIPVFVAVSSVGIILLLIGFYATHLYMLQNQKASLGLPKWVLIMRLPLQLVLIYWASQYI